MIAQHALFERPVLARMMLSSADDVTLLEVKASFASEVTH